MHGKKLWAIKRVPLEPLDPINKWKMGEIVGRPLTNTTVFSGGTTVYT